MCDCRYYIKLPLKMIIMFEFRMPRGYSRAYVYIVWLLVVETAILMIW